MPVRLPLSGVRVLDASTVFAMPYAAALMADLGAEVIKIEPLHRLDQTRQAAWAVWPENEPGRRPWDRGGPFSVLNRGKRSLALDMSRDEGRTLFRELVCVSDVVLENSTARVMRGWGLDYPHLRELRPDVIMVSNTGYGHNGPWENYPAQGTALEPTTGISHFSGYAGDRPWKIAQSYPDFLATWHGLFALMAALRRRALTGEGQWIDLGMYQVGVSLQGEAMLDFAANGRRGERIGNRDASGALQGVYRCAGDDDWVALTVRSDDELLHLLDLLNGSWSDLGPPGTLADAVARHDEVDAVIGRWTQALSREAAIGALRTRGIASGAVNDARDLLLDPQLRARGFYEPLVHAPGTGVGMRPVIGRAWQLSGTPISIRRPPPPLGEANSYVLAELAGLPQERIQALKDARITGQLPPLEEPRSPVSVEELLRLGRIREYDPDYRAKLGLGEAEAES